MKSLRLTLPVFLCLALAPSGSSAGPVENMIKFVTVGDPRNPDSDTLDTDLENGGVGYVAQEFQMAETEVTNEMYARFLNAVAKDDRLYGFYSTLMGTSGGIVRSGVQGSYFYQVKTGYGNLPVNFVSFFDALRFINWLHNGMPGDPQAENPARRTPLTGEQDATSTEDGAYTLLGANSHEIVRRNAGAKYFLPDKDEWHKSAYYDPDPGGGLPSQSYWLFADQSRSGPGGNFGSKDPSQPFKYGDQTVVLTNVKASSGPSHYGTYDQDGNAAEWLDASITSGLRSVGRGGGTLSDIPGSPDKLFTRDDYQEGKDPLTEDRYLGFRVAKRVASAVTGLGITPPTMVEVGEPGNPGDDTGPVDANGIQYRRGRVDYTYQVGAYEVTNEDYAKFLNAVAKDDTFYRLYDSRMQSDARGGIIRTGSNGAYVYSARPGFAKRPVNFVSLWCAMRYCNWLHNGAQSNGDTEAGAYRLLGNIPPKTSALIRNPSALYFLPTEDEWYKAAFYDPTAEAEQTGNYWSFATRLDNAQKNLCNYSGLFSVDVDTYLAQSYFGTFQQSGNIAEWTETLGRKVLGGSYEDNETGVSAGGGKTSPADTKSATIGFRIAAAPEALSVKFAADGDGDGMRDAWELLYGLNPSDPSDADKDADGDGLSNRREFELGLLPLTPDSDGDGLGDGAEVGTWKTDPANPDTDSDGLNDGTEVDPHKTDPKNADTDGDGFVDGLEVETLGTNPLAPEEIPFFSRVGDPGNPEDYYTEDLRGHVPFAFDMAITEVTNLMYAKFLNAVARKSDPKELYSPYMKLDPQGGIVRSGSVGAYAYAVKSGFESKPVGFVSYYDALRYVNWLHNGMPTGQQDLSTTEAGVYRMPDPLAAADSYRIQRNPDALYFLPDANEWHKAAYYDADRNPSESYWPFADKTDFGPGGNFATTAASGGDLIKLADVGTSSGASRFGTLDQDGNAGEWIETRVPVGEIPVNFGRKSDGGSRLTLHIDTDRDRLWFTGSASGNFGTRYRRATWSVVVPSLTPDPVSSTTFSGLSGDPAQLLAAPSLRGVQSVEIGSTVFFGGFRFTIVGQSAGETTLVGRGPEYFIDYSGTSPTAEFEFEFPQGSSAALEVGDSSFGPLAIEFSDWDNAAASAPGEPANIELEPGAERADIGFRIARTVPSGILPPPATLPQLVAVGESRNAGDPDANFSGGVDYNFKIGAYEVTNEEYASFLNATAKSDALYGLFDSRMTTDASGGILRKGNAGAYMYSAKPGFERKPVNFVSCYDAMRYCNWLNNGAQQDGDTESGAYRLLGELAPDQREIRRSFGARYFLPNEDEWRKAAYYDPSSSAEPTGNYWQFAVGADNANPSQVAVGGLSGLVDVNKPGLPSYFGTFGQSGNAAEWTEGASEGQRLVLGGGVASDWSNPEAAMSFYTDSTKGALDRGFRIAARADSPGAQLLALQTVKFTKLPAKRVIGAKPLRLNLRAKASSGLSVKFDITGTAGIATYHEGSVPYLMVSAPGTLTITARQPGAGPWASAQVAQTIEIVPRQTRAGSRR